jgi:hypothetical protein
LEITHEGELELIFVTYSVPGTVLNPFHIIPQISQEAFEMSIVVPILD